MGDVVSVLSVWGCGIMAVLATVWGSAVLITGRAPRRELRMFQSVGQYGRYCLGLGVAFALLALSNLGGWFGPLSIVGLGLLAWLAIRTTRSHRRTVRRRDTATDQP